MRRLAFLMVAVLCLASVSLAAMAAPKDTTLKVFVNGRQANLKPAAIERGGNAYLPLAATAKQLKATVKQNGKGYTVNRGNKTTVIAGDKVLEVNGTAMVQLYSAAKAFNCSARWDKASKCIQLGTKAGKSNAPPAKPAPGGG